MTHTNENVEWPYESFHDLSIQENWRRYSADLPLYLRPIKTVPFHILPDDVLARHPCFDPSNLDHIDLHDGLVVR